MNEFNDKDFLLLNTYGKKLYHQVAAALPIIDPHNHIDPVPLATHKQFDNLYQLWIKPDHYKSRAMRNCGVPEKFITGDASDFEKYMAWANCFASTAGNPLFHWTCMELKSIFGITEILSPATAKAIWDKANALLATEAYTAPGLLKRFNVEMLCTSDELLDTLEHHQTANTANAGTQCLPSLRGDTIVAFHQPNYLEWLNKLQQVTAIAITDITAYQKAIALRMDFFDANGCLLGDHAFDTGFTYIQTDEHNANQLFKKVLAKESLSNHELICLQSYILFFLGTQYAKRKWKMQLHIGAYRYTSTVLRKKAGPDGGYACIGNTADVVSICTFLDQLDIENSLPKTILYTLNPADNEKFASITGSYAEDGVPGKVQFGPAWWFNDHYAGIKQQIIALSSYGILGVSIGMTTDSRSLLSFLRHDYYRRILCDLLGSWVEEGKLPDDWELLSNLVKNISYYNVKNWIKK
jgi:glucuronate isomerase